MLQPMFHWYTIRLCTHALYAGITTCFQRKTMASQNLQMLSKHLSCQSYSGSCGIETSTMLSNEVTDNKKARLFKFLPH